MKYDCKFEIVCHEKGESRFSLNFFLLVSIMPIH